MQTRSFRGSGEPAWVIASSNACEGLGPDPRRALGPAAMRAASTGRTHDRTRPMLHQRKKALVNQAPSTHDRFCCKSLFSLAIKISFGCTGDFHVNMWGTSSSEEKLAGDPGNVIEATSIGGRWSEFFTAGKLAPGNFGLLQQYRPKADIEWSLLLRCTALICYS